VNRRILKLCDGMGGEVSTEEAQPLCGVTASPFPIRKPGFSVHVSAALDSEVDVAQERLVDLRAAAETSALDDQQKLMEEHAVASGLCTCTCCRSRRQTWS